MKGGKRIDPPLSIRQGSPNSAASAVAAQGIMKPNAVIHNNSFNKVNIGPTGATSMPENVQSQLQNDMRTLLNDPDDSIQPSQQKSPSPVSVQDQHKIQSRNDQ